MNILDLFGGVNRILVMLLGVLLLIVGVVLVVASNRGIQSIAGAASSTIPGAKIVEAVT